MPASASARGGDGPVTTSPGHFKSQISNLKSPPSPFAPLRLCAFALKTRHQASIKAKTPAIKANRASSRQTMKKPKPHHNERQRRGLIPAYGNAIGNAPHFPLSPEGASHPIKAETPLIVPNQASSKQTMKILIPLGNQPQPERGSVTRSNIQSPDRVRASITPPAGQTTLLRFTEPRSVRLARNPRPETHARFPNQGKNPCNRA